MYIINRTFIFLQRIWHLCSSRGVKCPYFTRGYVSTSTWVRFGLGTFWIGYIFTVNPLRWRNKSLFYSVDKVSKSALVYDMRYTFHGILSGLAKNFHFLVGLAKKPRFNALRAFKPRDSVVETNQPEKKTRTNHIYPNFDSPGLRNFPDFADPVITWQSRWWSAVQSG